MRQRLVLTLYGRAWCHLCEDMRQALLPLQQEFGFEVRLRDVDADPALAVRFGDLVPVLTSGLGNDEVVLCHYHLDEAAVRRQFA